MQFYEAYEHVDMVIVSLFGLSADSILDLFTAVTLVVNVRDPLCHQGSQSYEITKYRL